MGSYDVTGKGKVLREFRPSFDRKTKKENENYGIGYDYGSIMHYPRRHYVSNYKPSAIPKDPKYGFTMGSQMLAFSDLSMINEHYHCKGMERCKNAIDKVKCTNGGFPHPRQCSKCLCPGGYGGNDCSQRPEDGCGRKLRAKKEWQKIKLSFSNPNPEDYLDFYEKCTYWITVCGSTFSG
ncbi:astacin [Oesophagostomum dentatum]|uniref:Astacin n=1 Tax=Oesophagostomum dentatum TaxID=61180 RepID=A0A0B1S9T1_OESDE|nr:astacin [Oesophagostomum dentatum]